MTTPEWRPSWAKVDIDWQDRYEEAVVRHLLKRFRRSELEAVIARRSTELCGEPRLRLPIFSTVTGYPVWFTSKRLMGLETLEQDLWERPTKTLLFRIFEEQRQETPLEYAATGLVFHWPGHGKFNVLHNLAGWPDQASQGRFWYLKASQQRLWLQELDDLLADVGDDWSLT